MKRLKTILQSKIFIIITIILILVRITTFYCINNKSRYPNENATIEGKVLNIKEHDDYLNIIIKGKELFNCYYSNKDIIIKEKDIVRINGQINTPTNNTIPNTFNYKKYLKSLKIYKTINIKKSEQDNTQNKIKTSNIKKENQQLNDYIYQYY